MDDGWISACKKQCVVWIVYVHCHQPSVYYCSLHCREMAMDRMSSSSDSIATTMTHGTRSMEMVMAVGTYTHGSCPLAIGG
jgi:hypothetical protein